MSSDSVSHSDGGGVPQFILGLLEPGVLSPSAGAAELRETHISWLILTDEHVYKIKKPVDFGFLDFATLDKRRFYCQEEVRLNRRLSPGVYLGVVEIRRTDDGFVVGDSGALVDHAVKMRRLPVDGWLARRLDEGEVDAHLMTRIAQRIADFHEVAEVAGAMDPGRLETVRANCEENFLQTGAFVGETLDQAAYDVVRAFTRAFLDVRGPVFRKRESEGRIRDGHGDLHSAQICVENGIDFIDCIEFNERFRIGDVAADVAFLSMDIELRGARDLADAFIDAYARATGDAGLRQVLAFYECYRAYTRGKVESLRLAQQAGDGGKSPRRLARRYFRLARAHAVPPEPMLLLTTGLMGTGKSTLAGDLADRLDAVIYRSDEVRKDLVGMPRNQRQRVGWGEGIYSAATSEATYDSMHELAHGALARGRIVILDASYARNDWRHRAAAAARASGVPLWILHVTCDPPTVRRRLLEREQSGTGPSDGRIELADRQREGFQEPAGPLAGRTLAVDTAGDRGETVYRVLDSLYRRVLEESPQVWTPRPFSGMAGG